MRTRLTLLPGQNGTKRLVAKYGDRLVNVRYRYDAAKAKRYKTIELIVDESDWHPFAAKTLVSIRIDWQEERLREQVKQAGGHWRPHEKVWELSYGKVVDLGLENRIIPAKHI